MKILLLVCGMACGISCAWPSAQTGESPYLLVFAGDEDHADSDFLAVFDVRNGSAGAGKVVATAPIGFKASMPHHTEYQPPPRGEKLFINAHHHEKNFLVDISDPRAPRISKTLDAAPPFRFPHDFYRTPKGTRLVGFLRSEGNSPFPGEGATPGNQGGIAEYTADGEFIRSTSAASSQFGKPVRPYAFALVPAIDRLVVTSASMMEWTTADVVQIFRYSDLALLHTIALPWAKLPDGRVVAGAESSGFGPRVLRDGSVFFNAYGCGFYRLTAIETDRPRLDNVFTLDTPPTTRIGDARGACGIPVMFNNYWLQPSGKLNAVVVLDISTPSTPREVSRLATPPTFRPHWLARDGATNRLVLGAELGGEEGFFLLRFDDKTGTLSFDDALRGDGQRGYLTLKGQSWPHGESGAAWGHAALFIGR